MNSTFSFGMGAGAVAPFTVEVDEEGRFVALRDANGRFVEVATVERINDNTSMSCPVKAPQDITGSITPHNCCSECDTSSDSSSASEEADTVVEARIYETEPVCASCRRDINLQRCSGCNHEVYCSVKCQRADWLAGHYEECAIIAAIDRNGRRGTRLPLVPPRQYRRPHRRRQQRGWFGPGYGRRYRPYNNLFRRLPWFQPWYYPYSRVWYPYSYNIAPYGVHGGVGVGCNRPDRSSSMTVLPSLPSFKLPQSQEDARDITAQLTRLRQQYAEEIQAERDRGVSNLDIVADMQQGRFVWATST